MRVTPHRQFELSQLYSQTHYASGSRLLEQVSTGSRINRPSDDPFGQKIVLTQSSLVQQYTSQLTSINTADSVLSDAQTQVLDAQKLIVKAKDIALQARQSTEASERNTFASQLDSILSQLETIANAKSNGQYLFSGTRPGTQPFDGIASGASTSYQGSSDPIKVSIPGYAEIKTYYSGSEVFQPATTGPLEINGTTGIASGVSKSSGAATTTLTIRHTLTTYAGTSGIQAGSGSVAGDTILGPSGTHSLTIHDTSGNGTAGTVSLNGGEPVSFTSADGNLLVSGPNGEKVYVNTQSVTAGFNGTVDITASGTLSIDNGATEVPIDFSNNQTLTSSNPAVVQNFDTSALKTTGTVSVAPQATSDVFEAVRALRDIVRNSQNLNPTDLDAAYERSIQNLDNANDHLLDIVGQQSVDMQHLDTLQSRITTLQLNAQTLLTNTQGTDYTTAITQLQEQQNLLQFTLQSITTMSRMSLLDFLG